MVPSDRDRREGIQRLYERLFPGRPELTVKGMDEKKKLMLAQRLRGKYGCSKKQLARVLGIRNDLAERVLT